MNTQETKPEIVLERAKETKVPYVAPAIEVIEMEHEGDIMSQSGKMPNKGF